MIDILNLTFPELERFIVEDLGQPKFRAAQVWQWIWQKHATSFDAMTDVSKQLRAKLAEIAEIVLPEIVTVQTSSDGTEKLLLRLRDGALVETVILPSTGQDGSVRIAQCVSSQIGCAMGCTFCSTGTMGFIRNMTAGEILSQVLVARMRLGDNRIDHPIIRNLVFMGMGEPLLNLRETTRALEMLNHDKGMDFSPRRITVSTCGSKAGLRELGDSGLAFLAVSLHAPNQELRAKIMPKAANWHLDDLMATLESYPLKTREHITFEYLLLGGVNDQPEHARELAKLVSRVKGKLNLIAYNPSDNVMLPKKTRYIASYYNVEQLNELLRVVQGDTLETVIRLTALYGFRRSEVCGLKWSAVDFHQKTLTVRRAAVMVGTKLECIDKTKTASSYRTLPLTTEMAQYLQTLKAQQEEAKKLLGDKAYLEGIYKEGAQKASVIARKTLRKVYKKVGLVEKPF